VLLVVATVAALLVVPDWPYRHLDNPSYWGLIGYLVVFFALVGRGTRSWSPGSANRGVTRLFLAGLPAIYVANWIRFGGSTAELIVQVAGVAIWIGFAVAAGRSDLVLWAGCIAHALWDAAHFDRVGFVPVWYAAACVAADIGLGAFVLICLRESRPRSGAESPGAT
jgi:hypothetical protein